MIELQILPKGWTEVARWDKDKFTFIAADTIQGDICIFIYIVGQVRPVGSRGIGQVVGNNLNIKSY